MFGAECELDDLCEGREWVSGQLREIEGFGVIGVDVDFWGHRIGTGVLNAIVPVWATETAEHTSRGQFVAIEFTLNIVGVVVAYWLEFGLSFIDGGRSPFRWSEYSALRCEVLEDATLTVGQDSRLLSRSSRC